MAVKVNAGKFVKFLGFIVLVVAAYGYASGWFGRKFNKAEVVKVEDFQGTFAKTHVTNAPKLPLCKGQAMVGVPFLDVDVYDWHATTAIPFANCGPITVDDSLIGKEGLMVKVNHIDDTSKSIKEFTPKAELYKTSNFTQGGNKAFVIMGGASVSLVDPVQADLKKIDPSFQAIAITLVGKSDGEDQCVVPAEWLTNPELAKGKLMIGVYDDQDFLMCAAHIMKLGIPVNFDYRTYYPGGLNVENVDDFMKAEKRFREPKPADPRPIVDDQGHKTGKNSGPLPIDALASWTPADRNLETLLSKTDPGRYKNLATMTSTGPGEQYAAMPATLIVLNKYYEDHIEKFAKLLYAIHTGAIQIDAFPEALQRAMEYDTQLMGQWDEKDTVKARLACFKGYTAAGNRNLRIGGSQVFGFKDAMNLLGMDDSGDDHLANSTFASVYRSFGNLIVKKYPDKNITTFTPFEKFFDTRALRMAYLRAQREGQGGAELMTKREFTPEKTGRVLGSTNYQITFAPGSSRIDKNGMAVLQEIQDSYASSEYPMEIVGHTDRTGSDEVNIPLSKARADSTKAILESRNARAFGGGRITTDGKGALDPPTGVDPNYKGVCDTCRRVEIFIHK